MKVIPTPEQVRALFNYVSETGSLSWAPRNPEDFSTWHGYRLFCSRYVGKEVGSVGEDGYSRVSYAGGLFLKHILIWVWVHCHWPGSDLDHEDHDRGNNRINNLREATHAENMMNKTKYKGRDLPTGVYANGVRFVASIRSQGQLRQLGTFNSVGEAHAARLTAQANLGFHPNHGIAA